MATTNVNEPKKPLGTYEKQKRVTIVFVALVLILAVCASVAYYFVNLDKTSFEQGGSRYRVLKKDGVYVLTNEEGYTCEKTPDGYYVTDDGKLMVSVNEDGTYSVYAAVEGLEDGEEVYYRTDHHWNRFGSYAGYQHVLQLLGNNGLEGAVNDVRGPFHKPLLVRVLNAQDEHALFLFPAGKQIRIQRAPQIADVHIPRGARRKPCSYFHGFFSWNLLCTKGSSRALLQKT